MFRGKLTRAKSSKGDTHQVQLGGKHFTVGGIHLVFLSELNLDCINGRISGNLYFNNPNKKQKNYKDKAVKLRFEKEKKKVYFVNEHSII